MYTKNIHRTEDRTFIVSKGTDKSECFSDDQILRHVISFDIAELCVVKVS